MTGTLDANASTAFAAPVDVLNGTDVVIIQHEYGLYEGPDGDAVLETMAGVVVPMIVVAHTVEIEGHDKPACVAAHVVLLLA